MSCTSLISEAGLHCTMLPDTTVLMCSVLLWMWKEVSGQVESVFIQKQSQACMNSIVRCIDFFPVMTYM